MTFIKFIRGVKNISETWLMKLAKDWRIIFGILSSESLFWKMQTSPSPDLVQKESEKITKQNSFDTRYSLVIRSTKTYLSVFYAVHLIQRINADSFSFVNWLFSPLCRIVMFWNFVLCPCFPIRVRNGD